MFVPFTYPVYKRLQFFATLRAISSLTFNKSLSSFDNFTVNGLFPNLSISRVEKKKFVEGSIKTDTIFVVFSTTLRHANLCLYQ